MTEIEAAYFAGLFDGEGWVGIRKVHPKFHPRATTYQYAIRAGINMCDPRAIHHLFTLIGGSMINKPAPRIRTNRPTNHRPIYDWLVTATKAKTFLQIIRPYTRIKSEEIDIAMELQNRIESQKGKWGRWCPMPEEEIAIRESLLQQCRDRKHWTTFKLPGA